MANRVTHLCLQADATIYKAPVHGLPQPGWRIHRGGRGPRASRWNDPQRVGVDIVANLYREGIPEWVDATVIALNRQLGADSVTATEAQKFYEEDVKLWPFLKKLQTVERFWQTSVRRRPYDWFIYSSFE